MNYEINGNLMTPPNEEVIWYDKNYKNTISDVVKRTEFVCKSMLYNNIIGDNDRFVGYKKDRGMIGDLVSEYNCHEKIFELLIDFLKICITDASDNEYYTIANNINLIITSVENEIDESLYREMIYDFDNPASEDGEIF